MVTLDFDVEGRDVFLDLFLLRLDLREVDAALVLETLAFLGGAFDFDALCRVGFDLMSSLSYFFFAANLSFLFAAAKDIGSVIKVHC